MQLDYICLSSQEMNCLILHADLISLYKSQFAECARSSSSNKCYFMPLELNLTGLINSEKLTF